MKGDLPERGLTIYYQEVADELEQCQVCMQLDQLPYESGAGVKGGLKELIKTLDEWYENCEEKASDHDRVKLLEANCNIEDVLSSKEIKEKFLIGNLKLAKLISKNDMKAFPIYTIQEMKTMIDEDRISSFRDFFFHLWCWLAVIRSLKENSEACKLCMCF